MKHHAQYRYMPPRGLWGAGSLLLLALLAARAAVAQPDDEALADADQPIAVELAQGIDLLNDQIAQQQDLLKTAKSEREQELIRNHIRLLQKERRTFESLLHKLVGPHFEEFQHPASQLERQQEQWERKEELIRDRER